jgi:hypothetical protein
MTSKAGESMPIGSDLNRTPTDNRMGAHATAGSTHPSPAIFYKGQL